MNTIVKNVLLITIPSALSATITYIITKKIVSNKYEAEMEARISKEIKDFKKEYIEKMESEPKRIPQSQLTPEQRKKLFAHVDTGKEETVMPKEATQIESSEQIQIEEDINDNDEELYDDEGNEIGDPNDDIGYGDDVVSEDEENDNPFVISQEEYDTDDQYEKSSLKYYELDKILTNDNDYVLDINEIIGENSLEHFGDMSGDPTIVYVRNIPLNSDYEVQLVHGSFKHIVGDLR